MAWLTTWTNIEVLVSALAPLWCQVFEILAMLISFDIVSGSRLTVVNCGPKKKQAIHDEWMSYLQVAPAVNFVNALNKPPLKLYYLVINDSARSNHIELATQQWRKSDATNPEYQPLRV